jgi:hypothetical protein
VTRRRSPAAVMARALSVPHVPHLDDVYARLVCAMGAREPHAAALRLAAVVHEQAPVQIVRALTRAGRGRVAPVVSAVLAGFGEVWKASDDAAMAAYVRRHRGHLRPLLLFEVAHEGRATPAMRAAARLGGLAGPMARWTTRLAVRGARAGTV